MKHSTIKLSLQRGVFWKILSCLGFAVINVLLKMLKEMPATQLAFFQHLFGLIWLGFSFSKKEWKECRQKIEWIYILRGVLSAIGVLCWIHSLHSMGIIQVVTLGFLSPLVTVLGAHLFFKESLTVRRSMAIILGTLGAIALVWKGNPPGSFLIKAPCAKEPLSMWALWNTQSLKVFLQENYTNYFFLFPVLATILFSMSTLMAKRMVQEKSSKVVAFYLMVVMTVFFAFWLPEWSWPKPWQQNLLLGLGCVCAISHVAMNNALAYAEISFLIPFGSFKCIFSGLLGYFIFQETPNVSTIVGIIAILSGVFLLQWHQGSVRRKV
jgi:drug/metabolite transporter (DMT)-like permease